MHSARDLTGGVETRDRFTVQVDDAGFDVDPDTAQTFMLIV